MTAAEYNKCVEEHADALYRFILKNIKNNDKAKDIIQDTYETHMFYKHKHNINKTSNMWVPSYH